MENRSATLLFVVMAWGTIAGCGDQASDVAGPAMGGATSDAHSDDSPASGGGLNLGGSSNTDGGGTDGGCFTPPPNTCSGSDKQCDDGNPCTQDTCKAEGEFFKCTYTPISNCQGDPTAPIDSSCNQTLGCNTATSITVPYVPLVTPNLPATCNSGFEWQSGMYLGDCDSKYVVTASGDPTCGTASDRTVWVDIATYTAGDRLRITAVGNDNQPYVVLDTCRIRTWDQADPTDGKTRPPDATIRQFKIVVKAGTKSLEFDSTNACTPWYMRVLGLCDFEPLPPMSKPACAWRTASL